LIQLRRTEAASTDLRLVADYLFDRAPQHAPRVVEDIYDAAESLVSLPSRGRPGKKPGTRELVLNRLPYVVVYSINDEVVHIVRILHGAQKWP